MRVLMFSLACLFVVDDVSFGQCITRDSLWRRVDLARNTPRNKIDRLEELLKCKELVKNCPWNRDSIYTQLLISIGIEYYMRADSMINQHGKTVESSVNGMF